MKNFTLKSFLFAFVAIAFLTTFSACKKKSDDPSDPSSGGYPKTVDVEYRVTKLTGDITTVDVLYDNDSGGETSLSKLALPVSIKFKRTVNRYEHLSVLADNTNFNFPVKSIQVDILVDGKVVSTKKGETNNGNVQAVAVYVFP